MPLTEVPRTCISTNLDSLDGLLSNLEAVLRAQRAALNAFVQECTRDRRFTGLNMATPVPSAPSTKPPTPIERARLVMNDPHQAPGPHHLICDEQAGTEPEAAASNEPTTPGVGDSMNAGRVRQIVRET